MAKRSNVLDGAMLAPEATEICPGVKLRRMSLGSLDLLCKIASPFADLEKLAVGVEMFDASDIARFVYVHGAPLEEVIQTVEVERDKLSERSVLFAMKIPHSLIPHAIAAIKGDVKAVVASRADAIPDDLIVKSKNKQGLAE